MRPCYTFDKAYRMAVVEWILRLAVAAYEHGLRLIWVLTIIMMASALALESLAYDDHRRIIFIVVIAVSAVLIPQFVYLCARRLLDALAAREEEALPRRDRRG